MGHTCTCTRLFLSYSPLEQIYNSDSKLSHFIIFKHTSQHILWQHQEQTQTSIPLTITDASQISCFSKCLLSIQVYKCYASVPELTSYACLITNLSYFAENIMSCGGTRLMLHPGCALQSGERFKFSQLNGWKPNLWPIYIFLYVSYILGIDKQISLDNYMMSIIVCTCSYFSLFCFFFLTDRDADSICFNAAGFVKGSVYWFRIFKNQWAVAGISYIAI